MKLNKKNALAVATGLCTSLIGLSAAAQTTPSLNLYGGSGLIDMPSAQSQPDGQISGTFSWTETGTKVTLGFQLTNRLSLRFRYADLSDWTVNGEDEDRSFDAQFRILDETDVLPAVAIGFRDFTGQGTFGAEYIVATKTFAEDFTVTAGAGWGRLSDSATVRTAGNAQGGIPTSDQWFDGDVGVFGGIEWRTPVQGLTAKVEYSSDQYTREVAAGATTQSSQVNFGLEYRTKSDLTYGAYLINGEAIALRFSAAINPKRPPAPALERAPIPIMARPINRTFGTNWTADPGFNTLTRTRFAQVFADQGLAVEALHLTGTRAELRLRNDQYNNAAQAIGRAARVMALVLPHSVETFVITPVVDGLPASSVTLQRNDLEVYEFAGRGTEQIFAAADIRGAAALPDGAEYADDLYPKFNWAIGPYASFSVFDGSGPLRASAGIRASADYRIAPGLSLSGSVTQRVFGNQQDETPPASGLPRVRTDRALYRQQGETALERLTAEYLFKPHPDWYGRVSVGYLETMFGGVSTELLWKPAEQVWGLGAELNYVQQRDFDQKFGFQNYDVVTGHLSGYWQVTDGTTAQLDVGRYLAGDWGATLSVDRVFANGWKVGAYATVTDASSAQYGRGSFTKGIRLTVPLAWGIGTPTRKIYDIDMNTLARDGGARLDVENRLFGLVSEYHRPNLQTGWAKFWK